jgi:tetratricopeptide (TPR) repeat protein
VNYQPGPRVNVFYLDHAEIAPKRGWDNCVKTLRRALEIYPKVIATGPATSEPRWRFHRAQKILSQMPKLAFAERERLMQESLAGFKALIKEYPRDYRPRVEFCEAQSWWGMLLWSSGQPELAEEALRQAYAGVDRLVAEFPKTPYYPKLRASCATSLGMFLATTDRHIEGDHLLGQAINNLLAVPPGLVPPNELKLEAARAWEILALSHQCQGKAHDADHSYSEAFRIYAQLFREAPSRATFGPFVDICDFHCLSRIRAGRLHDADELVRDAISTTQQVAAAPGADPRIAKFEGGVLNVHGSVLQRLDRSDDSERAFEKSLEIFAKLDERYPDDESGFRGAYTGVQANRAINRRSSGQIDRCFELLRQRIEWLDRRAATNGAIAKHCRELAAVCQRFNAEELDFVGRLSESTQAYRDAIDRIQRLAAESPGRSDSDRDRAVCLMALAHVLQRANKEKEAIQAADQSLAIRRGSKADRQTLAFEQRERASIEAQAERVVEAMALLDDSIAKLGQLETNPIKQGEAKKNLQFVHGQRGWLLERVGQLDEAEADYRQALSLAQATVGDYARGESRARTPWFGSPPWYDGRIELECLAQTNLTFCHRALARFYSRHGRLEDAKRHVEDEQKIWGDLVARYPASAFAACNLAWCLVSGPIESLRDQDRALKLASRAVATDENYLTVATLGAARYRTGDYQGAVTCLELQSRLPFGRVRPDDLLFLAMARWRTRDHAGAQRDYQEAMRLAAMHRFEHVWDLVEQLRQEFETLKAQP